MAIGINLNEEVERKLKVLCTDETRKPTGMVERLIHLAYVAFRKKESEDKKGGE